MSRFKKYYKDKKHSLRVRLGLSAEEEEEIEELDNSDVEHFLRTGEWRNGDVPASIQHLRPAITGTTGGTPSATSSAPTPPPAAAPSSTRGGGASSTSSGDAPAPPIPLALSGGSDVGTAAPDDMVTASHCFICGSALVGLSNRELNAHFDRCLSGGPSATSEPVPISTSDPFKIECPFSACGERMEACSFPQHVENVHCAVAADEHLPCPVCRLMIVSYVPINLNLLDHVKEAHADLQPPSGNSWDRALRFSIPDEIGDGIVETVLKADIDKECAICFELFEKGETVSTMECFCMFHKDCAAAWFKRKERKCCPVHVDD
eukprot:TRINITY_DN5464_c0_g1_i1.p1 TRINITY_DN5464_c0_g1~~TRINITY_DN5464_c0_g1_i1.p1  ORF type:complete len:320 (+),score=81.10 TRINITY_DN5464_c0_g1_i1:199-1158(+)